MKHTYRFENISGRTSIIMTSHELEPETLEKYQDIFGSGCTYTVEPFDNDVARPVVAGTTEIDRLRTERDELTARCKNHYTEILQLTSKVMRYNSAISTFLHNAFGFDSEINRVDSKDVLRAVHNETHRASLNLHDAALLETVANKLCGDAEPPTANGWVKKMIMDEADKLRQEAEQ